MGADTQQHAGAATSSTPESSDWQHSGSRREIVTDSGELERRVARSSPHRETVNTINIVEYWEFSI